MNVNSCQQHLFTYCFFRIPAAFLLFVLSITGKRWSNRDPEAHTKQWGFVAFITSVVGFACHVTFFFTRWAEGDHIPTSNMYEFMTFLGMMIMFAFLSCISFIAHLFLGIALPVGFIIIAYASVFPSEVQPLIPALQSYWLKIHVTTAATGEAFFAVGFAGGLMYLLRAVDFKGNIQSR